MALAASIRKSPKRVWSAAAIGVLTISADFVLVAHDVDLPARGLFILPALIWLLAFSDWRPRELGLSLVPRPSWRYWAAAALAIGAFILVVAAGFLALRPEAISEVAWMGEVRTPVRGKLLWFSCVEAPLVEEGIYRLVFCCAALPLIGPRATIVVGGLLFAALHVHYGKPGPDNVLAGFFFTWAFLKSETIVIPIVLHSLGNFSTGLIQIAVASYYFS